VITGAGGVVFQPDVIAVLPLSVPATEEPTRLFRDGVLNGLGVLDDDVAAVPPESLESKFVEGETDTPPAVFDEDEPRFVESKSRPWLLLPFPDESRWLMLDEALGGGGGGLVNLFRFLPNFFLLLLMEGCSSLLNALERRLPLMWSLSTELILVIVDTVFKQCACSQSDFNSTQPLNRITN
jgi:hypothetical protein